MLAKLSKRFSFVLSLIMLLSVCQVPAIAANSFSDVPATFWAYNEIKEAVNKGITNGYTDGTFKPGNSVTNAHFATFLARAFYSEEYDDTNASPWYKPYTDTLESHGIMAGTAAGANLSENVNKAINRYDMAMMMYNVLVDQGAEMPSSSELRAAQNAIGDWSSIPANYKDAVAACYAMGVLNGQTNGTFGGSNLMNRAQGCVVVYRLTQKIETGSTEIETPTQPTEPEQPSTPSGGQTLANGEEVTVENVLEIIEELKVKYPEWSTYDPYDPPYYWKAKGSNGTECAKLAFMLSDEIFGTDAPARSHTNYEDMKPGDLLQIKRNDGTQHWILITTELTDAGKYFGVGGGPSGIVKWSERGYIDEIAPSVVWTRYPE